MNDTDAIQIQKCACGFKVRFGPQHAGRTVRCKDCGSALTLGRKPAPPKPAALEDSDPYGLAPAEVKLPGTGPATLREHQANARTESSKRQSNTEIRRSSIAERRVGGFWGDAGRAFVFWMSPNNAITLLVLVVMLVAADFLAFVPLLGLVASIAITGMVWAFYLQVIVHSAGGDDDLPNPSDWEGVFESVAVPIFSFLCVTIAVALPSLLAGLLTDNVPLIAGLGAAGLFLWPVALLVAAIAGPMAAFRLDALVLTVARAFLPYVAIWFLLIVAAGAQWLAMAAGLGALPDAAYEFVDN